MATRTNITQDASVRLMLKFPFWSELYFSMTVFEDYECPTLVTDGRNLWVNPDFWKTLTLDLKISAVAHEIGHKMLLHSTRRGARDQKLWNIAADYVVNDILKSNGFQLGSGWLFDAQYHGWSTEAVYADIEKKAEKHYGQGQGEGGEGENEEEQKGEASGQGSQGKGDDSQNDGDTEGGDSSQAAGKGSEGGGQGNLVTYSVPGVSQEWEDKWQDIKEVTGSKEQIEKIERDTIEQVQKAALSAKAHGKGVVGMDAFDGVCQPSREPWYNHLHRFMQSLSVSEYNWAKVNRRTLVQHNLFAPHHYSESLGKVVFAIDCSGSVFGAAEQANFAGHVNAILAEAKPSKVHVMYFDSKVTRHDELDYGCLEFSTRPKGGGGTSFAPIFAKIEDEGIVPELVVVLTDCFGDYPREEPQYPVIWASIEEDVGSYYPPFGEFMFVS